ncbi:unnamed protein product [Didymodactylos carnosus]|uniref:Uncharacterized protein n=1 Tax=Didymodactylos carnosus TaxID=1234261 RepID=A0A8S2Q8G8_9BILA|nr:unnamed protein product [Didymodactylos carnosus]CAF4094399.1 unnamed protein product [Didymodactylos carnosus]
MLASHTVMTVKRKIVTKDRVKKMPKTNIVYLVIDNRTRFELGYIFNVLQSGQLADDSRWPREILPGSKEIIQLCEKDGTLNVSGCSGFVNYSLDDELLTIAFENPSIGKNKLTANKSRAGQGGVDVWETMDDYGYQDHLVKFHSRENSFLITTNCTGSSQNQATVVIEQIQQTIDRNSWRAAQSTVSDWLRKRLPAFSCTRAQHE